jgi:hypothetical protein
VANDPVEWGVQVISLLEELTPYRRPDGSGAGLLNISNALLGMLEPIASLIDEVRSVASSVDAHNSGEAASSFKGFAGQLETALLWLGQSCYTCSNSVNNLWALKGDAWQELGQTAKFLISQQATMTAHGPTMSAAEAEFDALVQKEGQSLLAQRKVLDLQMLEGLPGTFTTPPVQFVKATAGQAPAVLD